MCDEASRRAPHVRCSAALVTLLLAGALAAPGGPLGAQQTEEDLVRHLHDLLPRLDSARAVANAARAAVNARDARPLVGSIDTFVVGPLRILTPSGQRRVAESFFRDVWENEYAPFVRSSPDLARTRFTFQWAPELGRIAVDGPVRRVESLTWRPAPVLRVGVVAAIAGSLGADLPDSLAHWAGSDVRDRSDAAPEVFREVTVTASASNRACLDGDARACWTSLGLDLDGAPIDDWYTPEERRARVAAFGSFARDRMSLRNACVEERSTDACDVFLERWYRVPPIQDSKARSAMVWIALRAGGSGAWDRLRADPGATPADALRFASGLTTEELGARWRAWVLQGAPPERALLDPHLLTSIMWIVAFAALATRSTRWRLR